MSLSLSAKNKTEATNIWGVSVFRYYFTTLWWPRTILKQLDKVARKVITNKKGHHRCAALEWLYLPGKEGGRGLMMVEQQCEKEQISLVAYLQKLEDPWLQAVLHHMITKSRDSSSNPVSACRFILQKYGVPMPESDDDVAYIKHRVGEDRRKN